MGYHSTFELRVKPLQNLKPNVVQYFQAVPPLAQVNEAVRAEIGFEMHSYPDEPDCLHITDVSWYAFEADFMAVSKRFPNAVLEVTRYGEDDGDIERKFFHNGQVGGGKATIVFPPNPFEVSNGQ